MAPDQIVIHEVINLERLAERVHSAATRPGSDVGRTETRRRRLGSKEVFAGTRVPVTTVRGYLERVVIHRRKYSPPFRRCGRQTSSCWGPSVAPLRCCSSSTRTSTPAVGVMLRREGHHCLSAQEVGLSGADDDDVSVYAHNHHAVVVSHDEALSRRRRKNVYGKHVWLRCREEAAPDLLRHHLTEVVEQLDGVAGCNLPEGRATACR